MYSDNLLFNIFCRNSFWKKNVNSVWESLLSLKLPAKRNTLADFSQLQRTICTVHCRSASLVPWITSAFSLRLGGGQVVGSKFSTIRFLYIFSDTLVPFLNSFIAKKPKFPKLFKIFSKTSSVFVKQFRFMQIVRSENFWKNSNSRLFRKGGNLKIFQIFLLNLFYRFQLSIYWWTGIFQTLKSKKTFIGNSFRMIIRWAIHIMRVCA